MSTVSIIRITLTEGNKILKEREQISKIVYKKEKSCKFNQVLITINYITT